MIRTNLRRALAALSALVATTALVVGLGGPSWAMLPPGIPSKSAAQSQLNSITVRAEGASSAYDRALFPHWITIEGACDTRKYVLRWDGYNVTVDSQCRAISGSWYSDYDGVTTTDPSTFDIDHMVPLAEAWRSGADTWTTSKRRDFANDVTSPQLWAVTASSNRAKGDKDPAKWMPPRTAVHCDYVKSWINVKYRYGLTVDSAEKTALQNTLNTRC